MVISDIELMNRPYEFETNAYYANVLIPSEIKPIINFKVYATSLVDAQIKIENLMSSLYYKHPIMTLIEDSPEVAMYKISLKLGAKSKMISNLYLLGNPSTAIYDLMSFRRAHIPLRENYPSLNLEKTKLDKKICVTKIPDIDYTFEEPEYYLASADFNFIFRTMKPYHDFFSKMNHPNYSTRDIYSLFNSGSEKTHSVTFTWEHTRDRVLGKADSKIKNEGAYSYCSLDSFPKSRVALDKLMKLYSGGVIKMNNNNFLGSLKIKDVQFHSDITTVIWSDDTKTMVKNPGGELNTEKSRTDGVIWAIAKKFFGNKYNSLNELDKIVKSRPAPMDYVVNIEYLGVVSGDNKKIKYIVKAENKKRAYKQAKKLFQKNHGDSYRITSVKCFPRSEDHTYTVIRYCCGKQYDSFEVEARNEQHAIQLAVDKTKEDKLLANVKFTYEIEDKLTINDI